MTDKTVRFQLTIHTPWGPVVLYPERPACTPSSDFIPIVGTVTLDKLGLSLNNRLFQVARTPRAGRMSDVENPGSSSSGWMILSVPVFQHGRDVEPGSDEAVEQLLSRGAEMFMAPDDKLREHKVALDRGLQQALEKGLLTEHAENVRVILSCHVNAF